MTSAPYISKAWEAAWRRRVRQEYQECRQKNPKLMRRLRKLSDAQLDRVYAALLELTPPSPKRDYELRLSRDLEFFRNAPKPGRVKSRRTIPANTQPAPPLQDAQTARSAPFGLGRHPPHDLTWPAPTAGPAAAQPEPVAVPPDNVIRPHFGPVAFGVGGRTHWLGGEV